MPVLRVHHTVDVPQEIIRLERRGHAVLFTRRVDEYVEITYSEPEIETRDGAA